MMAAVVAAAALAMGGQADARPLAARASSALSPGYFSTLPPGSSLPAGGTCAGRVRPAAEQRLDNALANATVPTAGGFTLAVLDGQNGYNQHAQALEARVTGNFTGTTDEIIQWAACKWGFDENVVRAIAVAESNWHQNAVGDWTIDPALCPPGRLPPCPRSFGIHQVTWSSDPVGTYPWSRRSTAFNLDASLLVHRICFEGDMRWLRDVGYSSYAAGDLWGCVGQWYSGGWHDPDAQTYITRIKGFVATHPWTQLLF
jgi:autotransporter family porin